MGVCGFHGALSDLFSFAVSTGNAAWLCFLVALEREEEENETNGEKRKRGSHFFRSPSSLPYAMDSAFVYLSC